MLLSTLATLGEIGATIYGQYKSRQENKNRIGTENATFAENERILNTRLNTDLSRGSEFQGYWNAKQKADDRRISAERGINAVAGGNDNAVNAQREAVSRSEAQMGSTLASRADNVKMATENALISEQNRHSTTMQGIYKDRADQITRASAQYANLMSSVASNDGNTIGDDLNMFGLPMNKDKWERIQSGDAYHWVKKG